MHKRLIAILITVVVLFSVVPAFAQSNTMQLRVAHFSPDAPAVDVYVNGEVAIAELAYPNVTEWLAIEEGNYDIAVAPAGTSIDDAVIGPATFNLVAGTWVTVAAVGSVEAGTLAPNILIEDYSTIPEAGFARISVAHVIEGAPEVNVVANGIDLITRLAYPGTQGSNDGFFIRNILVGSADISVVLASDPTTTVIGQSNVELEENMNYFIAAVGTPNAPELVIVATPIGGDMMADMGEDDMMDEDMSEESMDEEMMSETITDIVVSSATAETPQFSVLLAAVSAADPSILETLSDPATDLTVFAPTDDAFNALLEALEIDTTTLFADTELLNTVLAYHVLDGAVMAETVVTLDGQSVPTLLGEDATISISITNDGVVLNDDVNVLLTDIVAENGVIHVIDAVLVPMMDASEESMDEEMSEESMDEEMSEESMDEDMSEESMDEDMSEESMDEEMSEESMDEEMSEESMDEEMSEESMDEEMSEGSMDEEMSEESMDEEMSDESMDEEMSEESMDEDMSAMSSRWEAMVATTELIGTNPMDMGDMEESMDEEMSEESMDEEMSEESMDEEMSEESMDEETEEVMEAMSNTIADIVVTSAGAEDPQFTVLLAAVSAADPSILDALSNPEAELTVFAPTDDAFVALLEALEMDAETLLADTDLLNTVLQYHVLEGAVFAETVVTLDGESVPTLLGEDATISISIGDDGVVLNETVNVVVTDFEADNGVVHVIDAVLVPETE